MTLQNKEYRGLLEAPFPEKDIEWRVQRVVKVGDTHKAIMLAYLTSRAVMQRLDDVFGVFGWQDEYERWGENGVKCTISVRDPVTHEWVRKVDGADDTDIEATKGGFSNSLKRACVKLGIGRYLYNLDEAWCDIHDRKPQGDAVYINDKRAGVTGYVARPKLPDWALPAEGGYIEPKGITNISISSVGSPEEVAKAVKDTLSKSEATTPAQTQTPTVTEQPPVKKALDAQIRAIRKMVNMLEVKGVQVDGKLISLKDIVGDKDMEDLTFDEAAEAIKRSNELVAEVLSS